jgi:hypothetical protein
MAITSILKNIVIYLRTWIKLLVMLLIGFAIIGFIVFVVYKPMYRVSVNGEVLGYTEDKSKLDTTKRNGAIITKTYYIDISSDLQSGLEILSKIPGDRLSMCPNTISEVSELISKEKSDNITRNDYKNYDNVLTPNSIASEYYQSKGRYDLVPINLSASDVIDYQICSPNMYQSAQCKGQFVYSRFRNVSDTYNMYANTLINGVAAFDPKTNFINSEITYKFTNNNTTKDDEKKKFWIERFNFYRPNGDANGQNGYEKDLTDSITDKQKQVLFDYIVELYDNLTGSSLSSFLYFTETDIELFMWKYTGESTKNGENVTNSYAARNIITNKMPTTETQSGDISIIGIYYMDANGDFDIYTEKKKNYTDFE